MNGNSRSAADAALKSLTRVLIERVGGVDAAAAVLNNGHTRGVKRSQVANYYNPACDQFLPIDLAARLEEVAVGEPVVTAELARRAGYVLTRPAAAPGDCVLRELADVQAEAADLSRALAEGLQDGHLCAEDLARIEREGAQLHTQLSELMATLSARRSPRPGSIMVVDDGRTSPLRGMGSAIAAGLRRMRGTP